MSKKIFKDRAVMRKRMVLALGFIVAIFGLLIVRLSYVMIVKRKFYEELFLITSFKNYYKNLFILDILEIFSMLLLFIIIGIFTRAFILRERSKF